MTAAIPYGRRGLASVRRVARRLDLRRAGPLVGALGLIGAFVGALYELVTVTGDPRMLVGIAVAAVLVATVFARLVPVGYAVAVATLALSLGLGAYLYALPFSVDVGALVASMVHLTTGGSALQIRQTTLWALVITPAPVFLTWYLALQRWYAAATFVGAAFFGLFVLTGDAGPTLTLVGVAGAATTLGFGDIERGSGNLGSAEYLLLALGIMVVAPLAITVVPGGAVNPISVDAGGGSGDMESAVVDPDDELAVSGSIDLSPEVRFTVEADRGRYWRVASYARYTGEGWIQVGDLDPYNERSLRPPEGRSYRLAQNVTVETSLRKMPAAWRPVSVDGERASLATVRNGEELRAGRPLRSGERYQVVSAVHDVSDFQLERAGTDYPADLASLYTQLPSDTPDRLARATEQIAEDAEAENPYQVARAVERHLQESKGYSLDVDKPDENVADEFLFEMEEGYCTYFATTMTTMLRTQDVPARVAVGYSTGQRIDDDRWVVRGSNAHAWVEVYFPDIGWVEFDPTPSGPREDLAQSSLEEAREDNETGVDTEDSADVPPDGATAESSVPGTERSAEIDREIDSPAGGYPAPEPVPGGEVLPDSGDDGLLPAAVPDTDRLALGAIVLLGAVAGLRRSRFVHRTGKRLRVRYQRRRDPATDVERAFDRLLLLLELRHRPREAGETVREYLAAIDADPRARRVAAIRERSRYAGEVSADRADEAVDLVDSLRSDGAAGETRD